MLDWDLRRVGKGAEQDRELNKYSRAAPCPRVEWWARPRAHSAHTNEAHCGAVFRRARLCAHPTAASISPAFSMRRGRGFGSASKLPVLQTSFPTRPLMDREQHPPTVGPTQGLAG